MRIARTFRLLKVVPALGLLFACATINPPLAPKSADAHTKRFLLPEGKAGIYLYRGELGGFAARIRVALDGRTAGYTGARTYFAWYVNPGPHRLVSYAENTSSLTLDVQAGKLYFVRQNLRFGTSFARADLIRVTGEEGRRALRKCRLLLYSHQSGP